MLWEIRQKSHSLWNQLVSEHSMFFHITWSLCRHLPFLQDGSWGLFYHETIALENLTPPVPGSSCMFVGHHLMTTFTTGSTLAVNSKMAGVYLLFPQHLAQCLAQQWANRANETHSIRSEKSLIHIATSGSWSSCQSLTLLGNLEE